MMFRTLAPLFFTTSTAVAEGVDAMSTGSEMSLAGLSDEDREQVEALMALVSAGLVMVRGKRKSTIHMAVAGMHVEVGGEVLGDANGHRAIRRLNGRGPSEFGSLT